MKVKVFILCNTIIDYADDRWGDKEIIGAYPTHEDAVKAAMEYIPDHCRYYRKNEFGDDYDGEIDIVDKELTQKEKESDTVRVIWEGEQTFFYGAKHNLYTIEKEMEVPEP